MQVRDAMTAYVRTIPSTSSVREAATTMAEIDAGILPVVDDDKPVGIVTDRDIALRAVGQGLGPDTPVAQVMTPEVKFCFEDEEVDAALAYMKGLQVRRLPVMNRSERLVGILSLGDLAIATTDEETLGDTLSGISEPGGPRSQTIDPEPATAENGGEI